MPEQIITGYKKLFEVRLLHHYWLDKGEAVFDSLDEAVRNKLLLSYNCHSFLSVRPTPGTEKRLRRFQGVFKPTPLGFIVAVAETAFIPDNAVFTFAITVAAPSFFNYTALTLPRQRIHVLYHKKEEKTYRYKEQVPVLSNLSGVSRTINAKKLLFLSKPYPGLKETDKVEALVKIDSKLHQLRSDAPGAATFVLASSESNAPVYLHQDNVPILTPPAGLDGIPPFGVQLTAEVPDDVFAVVQIQAVNATDNDFSCTTNGSAKENPPVFEVRFKNRSTRWRYFNKRSGDLVSTEANPLPLTFHTGSGVKRKPSEERVNAVYDKERTRVVNFFMQETRDVIAAFLEDPEPGTITAIKALFPEVAPASIEGVLGSKDPEKATAFFAWVNPFRVSELFSDIYE